MTQFDVYTNPIPETKRSIPYLLGVQSDLLMPANQQRVGAILEHLTNS